MESIGTNVLFVMQPVAGMDMLSKTENTLNLDTLEIRQTHPPEVDGNTKYNVFTAKDPAQNLQMNQLDNEELYLELPRKDLKRLIKYTRDLIAAHPELKTDQAKAKFLESHLRDSGEFSYTLNMSIVDPSIDPVEDFLFNRKTGHCEYYASSLALMLRAIGIPSRVISGFKGGDSGYLNNRFEVQQRYAHSWVEGFVNQRWTTLDATPSLERAEMVAQSAPSLERDLKVLFPVLDRLCDRGFVPTAEVHVLRSPAPGRQEDRQSSARHSCHNRITVSVGEKVSLLSSSLVQLGGGCCRLCHCRPVLWSEMAVPGHAQVDS